LFTGIAAQKMAPFVFIVHHNR